MKTKYNTRSIIYLGTPEITWDHLRQTDSCTTALLSPKRSAPFIPNLIRETWLLWSAWAIRAAQFVKCRVLFWYCTVRICDYTRSNLITYRLLQGNILSPINNNDTTTEPAAESASRYQSWWTRGLVLLVHHTSWSRTRWFSPLTWLDEWTVQEVIFWLMYKWGGNVSVKLVPSLFTVSSLCLHLFVFIHLQNWSMFVLPEQKWTCESLKFQLMSWMRSQISYRWCQRFIWCFI